MPIVGLGTWATFDVPPGEADFALPVVAAAFEGGSRLVDSSPMYGHSEEVLAGALAPYRQAAIVATKIWTDRADEARRQYARQRRLFGRVEIEQIHNILAWKTHLPWLRELRAAGEIDAIGATHWDEGAYPELAAVMETGEVDIVQVPYNPLQSKAAESILPLAQELDIGVIAMRPLAEGALLASSSLRLAAGRLGLSTAAALLAWTLSDDRIDVAIPATRIPAHAAENAASGSGPWLSREQRDLLARSLAR